MERCFIFGALPVKKLYIEPEEDDYIIAADNGYKIATALGYTPDLVVGDFDSLGKFPDVDDPVILDVRKDDTDLEHAVSIALNKGYDHLIIYGSVGGKLDHTIGNIAVAEQIALAGARSVFFGDDSSFTVIHNTDAAFPKRDSGRISVFSLCERSRGVSIRGLSYEVSDIALKRATTLGVSNAFIGKESFVSVKDGTLLIVFDSE